MMKLLEQQTVEQSQQETGTARKLSDEVVQQREQDALSSREMISPVADQQPPRSCTTKYYIQGWALGTGLRVSLPPGRYQITGEETFQGARFFRLNNRYRVAARDVQVEDEATSSAR